MMDKEIAINIGLQLNLIISLVKRLMERVDTLEKELKELKEVV